MAAGRTLEIKITGDSKDLSRAFGSAGRSADSFGKKVQGGAHKAVKALAVGAGLAAAGGIALLGKGLLDGVKTAIEHEKALAQTKAVIKSTGGSAKVSAQHILGLSDKIEKMTGIDDLATQAGANMLLTFTNIKNGAGAANKVFDKSVNVLADMTTALGSDPQKQAIQLGKALNDPVKGISALSRVGVTFTKGQKDSIKAMVASGNTMGAQKLILKELQKEFGGSAKAAGTTMAGKVNILKAHLEDLEQSIGQKVIPVLTRLVDWAIANWPTFEKVARQAMEVIGNVWDNQLHPALSALIGVVQGIMGLSDGWKTVILAVGGAIAGIVLVIEAYTLVTKIAAIAQLALNLAMTANPIGLVVLAIAGLVGAMVILYTRSETVRDIVNAAFGAIKKVGSAVFDFFTDTLFPAFKAGWNAASVVVTAVVDNIKDRINAVKTIFSGVINLVKALIDGDWSKAWDAAKQIVSGVVALINSMMLGIPGKILGVLGDVKDAAGKLASGVVDKITGVFSGLADTLSGLVKAAINAAIGILNSGFNVISGHWPDIPGAPGAPFGKNPIPKLAAGGIVKARPGGTLTILGEGGRDEAVIPLSRGGGMSTVEQHFHIYTQGIDEQTLAAKIAWQQRTAGAYA